MAEPKSGMSQLAQQINWALKNSGGNGMGGMAAMMGVPFQQKRGGQWMTIDPRSQSIYASGTTPPPMPKPQPPTTGGDGPTPDGDANNQEMIKAGLPPWYVDWLNTSGKNGGVPPTPGLLG